MSLAANPQVTEPIPARDRAGEYCSEILQPNTSSPSIRNSALEEDKRRNQPTNLKLKKHNWIYNKKPSIKNPTTHSHSRKHNYQVNDNADQC